MWLGMAEFMLYSLCSCIWSCRLLLIPAASEKQAIKYVDKSQTCRECSLNQLMMMTMMSLWPDGDHMISFLFQLCGWTYQTSPVPWPGPYLSCLYFFFSPFALSVISIYSIPYIRPWYNPPFHLIYYSPWASVAVPARPQEAPEVVLCYVHETYIRILRATQGTYSEDTPWQEYQLLRVVMLNRLAKREFFCSFIDQWFLTFINTSRWS